MIDLQIRILIIDDMAAMRMAIIKACKNLGFSTFVEAEDGERAWKLLDDKNSKFGLIISDLYMPNSDGLTFLKKIRMDKRFKKMPFLMVTSENEKSEAQKVLDAGVTHFLVKPFSPSAFKEALLTVLLKIEK